jgi:ribA/ribD-fused uncharacterized protein
MSDVFGRRVIDDFVGEFEFLSNFYESPMKVFTPIAGAWVVPTLEHAYQLFKTNDPDEQRKIAAAYSPGKAKRMGQRVTLREDWEDTKLQVMLSLLQNKFSNPVLRQKLLDTGDAELIEGNTWGDTFWGVCKGTGQNWLGILLMRVRDKLKETLDKPETVH